jgi:hypothetical protein
MANRLAKYSQEIKTFIFSQNIDILFISKIYFTNMSYCRILGHTLYHRINSDGKVQGGTALIRSGMAHYESGKYHKEFLQPTNIVIEEWLYYYITRILTAKACHK